MLKNIFIFLFYFFGIIKLVSQTLNPILETNRTDAFVIANTPALASIYVDENDFNTVRKSAEWLQHDIELVSEKKPNLINSLDAPQKFVIIIGSLTQSKIIKKLVGDKKIIIAGIANQWEAYQIQIVNKPMKGIEKALVIVGSDRRGTAFGVFDLCQMIGVSPWYWWADVPVKKKKEIYLKGNFFKTDKPSVKYRGIFINDEAPALSGWTKEKFGGFNAKFYDHVFELILRLKGNYLWPAMWGNAFYDDDVKNGILADEYGIVMGTSHHEPLGRAHDEWRRYGKGGKWNYAINDSSLRNFWTQGVERIKNYDKILSVGMRGDGDEPMTRETATALLEHIVKDQRKIINDVTGKPAAETPQLWALYKEVQDYYDKGMRVDDDITLLLCDDNWGNIRKLPNLDAPKRVGGYGIYYHYDYVGGPRNYKWLNTNNINRVWEQMHLAYNYDVKNIWIVNVGDIKPMEYPISFFLDYAWSPETWTLEKLPAYSKLWAEQNFGMPYSNEVAEFLEKYSKFNARCKPELLSPETYSLENYNEFETVVNDYKNLATQAQTVYEKIDTAYRTAYYQLVLFPILACSNLNELYYTVALNRKFYKNGNPETNALADKAEALFKRDAELSAYYNQELSKGKWNHFADQTHIGYTYWQQPEKNSMPEVERLSPDKIQTPAKIIGLIILNNKKLNKNLPSNFHGFIESDGHVSMEAEHFTRAIDKDNIKWKIIPDIGKTGGGVTIFPVNILPINLSDKSPCLEYDLWLKDSGEIKIQAYLSPTLEFNGNKGLSFAVSFDEEKAQIIEMHKDKTQKEWNTMVAQNIKSIIIPMMIKKSGKHTLKFWAMDAGVILQRIVIDLGGLKSSYLCPPESIKK